LRSLLFWDVMLACYQHFGLTYRSHHQGSSSLLGLLDIPEEQINSFPLWQKPEIADGNKLFRLSGTAFVC